jgi:hypothetical protein
MRNVPLDEGSGAAVDAWEIVYSWVQLEVPDPALSSIR